MWKKKSYFVSLVHLKGQTNVIFFFRFLAKCLKVTTVAGWTPTDVSWDIKLTAGGDSVCNKPLTDTPGGDYPTECCFTISGEYTITCSDDWADGWDGHKVLFDGVEKCAGFDDGDTKIDTFTIDVSGIRYTYYVLNFAPNPTDWSSL